ncbi:hypothetical protein HBI56_198860 [Parastagonospora nodorum]|uniref:Uncharacterized protein n=1 Tax=Phaeosphaeria nodorum (strain SN15 / ATCC MYA-4574 / FGSC 10173) TaxID=321614 RepID=A0A7U2I4N3_PHANO|nr:hypothetical protein HBH56_203910 [Parastagonospora nodorum]QRD01715.1 hypothetical protein JI435_417190 [Parastagonospora nodorum SN15]KAH3923980.1 hypothetical protein HBH54_202780 [Parastagonospora nodorum]KAH3941461.1 hypothetical protein HBH53_201590 [Parastagonospora nodorum]KAH3959520.1 hypothetical protein HBH51_198940 [Parastagonospora nodorum]
MATIAAPHDVCLRSSQAASFFVGPVLSEHSSVLIFQFFDPGDHVSLGAIALLFCFRKSSALTTSAGSLSF